MNVVRKGMLGELKIQIKLLELGYNVFRNLCDDGGLDLVIEKDNRFLSIQAKTAISTKSIEKYNRLPFRLGDSKKKPNFVICNYLDVYWIIPVKNISSNSFQIYLSGRDITRYNKFKNEWSLLDMTDFQIKEFMLDNKIPMN